MDDMRVTQLLGSGAMTQVWLAESATGRKLALKTLKAEWASHPGGLALVRREHSVLHELRHAPHVVASFGLVELGNSPALATEYLGGGDLVSLAGAHPRHWARAARDLLAALGHVHASGWVHRDVKARNVLFDEHDRARLVDFGSAARAGSPHPRGGRTVEHAPRACAGGVVSPVDDVYAFAVVIYELMYGRLPFDSGRGTPIPASPALPACYRSNPALAELRELVVGTIRACRPPVQGSLCRFSNVIESVVASSP
jgi:serine/threonine protein kinase